MRTRRMGRVMVAAAVAGLLGAFAPAAASAAPYAPHQLVVKFAPGVANAQRAGLIARLGLGPTINLVHGVGAVVFRVAGDPARAATRVSRSSLVAYAEPNYVLRLAATPNDPRFADMWGLNNTGQTGGTADADIDAPEGWTAFGLGAFPATGGVKVGIVDTGIQKSHPDLGGKTVACGHSRGVGLLGARVQSGCADDNGHGTHVAGTIAAKTSNAVGVAGVAVNAKLVICRALGGPTGTGLTVDIANCVNWVKKKGAKVISMSLGGGDNSTLKAAVDKAWANGNVKGAVIVAAAGNDGNSTLSYPAAYSNVISVAATDDNDQHAGFSNANNDVEISAPGVDVLSTYLGSGYAFLSGTSMATPHVSGVAALLRWKYPTETAAQIVARLDAATDDLGAAGRDPVYGFGRINLFKAATG